MIIVSQSQQHVNKPGDDFILYTYGILSRCLSPKSAINRVYMGLRFLLLSFTRPVQTYVKLA